MKTENQNGTSTQKIKHRLVLPIQTRGSLGKSTEAIVRAEWMRQNSVPWKGYDLDVYNRTLSETYPEEVTLVEPSREPVADIIKNPAESESGRCDSDRPTGPHEQDHPVGHRSDRFSQVRSAGTGPRHRSNLPHR